MILHVATATVFFALALALGAVRGILRGREAPPSLNLALWGGVLLLAAFCVGFGERARQDAPFEWIHWLIVAAGIDALLAVVGVIRYLLRDHT